MRSYFSSACLSVKVTDLKEIGDIIITWWLFYLLCFSIFCKIVSHLCVVVKEEIAGRTDFSSLSHEALLMP